MLTLPEHLPGLFFLWLCLCDSCLVHRLWVVIEIMFLFIFLSHTDAHTIYNNPHFIATSVMDLTDMDMIAPVAHFVYGILCVWRCLSDLYMWVYILSISCILPVEPLLSVCLCDRILIYLPFNKPKLRYTQSYLSYTDIVISNRIFTHSYR